MNATTAALAACGALAAATPAVADDRQVVGQLDLAYQAAVKRNDTAAMDRILHPQFVLVRSDGGVVTRAELLAGEGSVTYEIQDEDPGTQTVRLFGPDTAVVTARLRLKGKRGETPFDRLVWFSDTYVRTPDGWRYAFAQVSEAPAAQRGSGR